MSLPEKIFNKCWHFVRGDTPAREFENWVYEASELQLLFSEEFYMTLISTDYSSSGPILVIKRKLKEQLNRLVERDCSCHTLSNIDAVGMGEHTHIFQSLDSKAKYGEPLWWLWLAQCNICEEFWMIGSEERINDVFIMKRLSHTISQMIINESFWPEDFKKFETLLIMGKERGHSVRFVDPVSPALVYTAIDLAKAKPEIEIKEISELLQINLEQAQAVVKEASKDSAGKIIMRLVK